MRRSVSRDEKIWAMMECYVPQGASVCAQHADIRDFRSKVIWFMLV
jgi:hypothetical protein